VVSIFTVIRGFGKLLMLYSPLAAVENPRLEYAIGVHEQFHGDFDEAGVRFENARLAEPFSEILMKIGAARLLGLNDRPGAIRLYRELAAARTDDLSVQLSYADFITGLDREDALARKLAVETLEAALIRNPGHPEIIRRLVSIHLARGEKNLAIGLLEELPADDPECALLYASISRTLHDKDDADALAEVDKRLLQALQSHPQSAALARAVSDHFRNTGRVEQAIDVLKQHTQVAPWSLDMRVRLGVLRFSAKHDVEGEATLKEVLAIDPFRALAHQSLAKFYRQHDRAEAAGFHARELLKIRGGSPSEFIKLADETMSAGDPREARLLLEKAVFDQPENPELAMKLAIATHRDPGTRARASRLFREAEAAAPDGKITDPVFLTESAAALIESGQSKAAEERLRAAIRTYSPDAKKETATALRRLAALWKDENRNADAARALLQRADALDPR
jgi:predicted Zn-dependent protease